MQNLKQLRKVGVLSMYDIVIYKYDSGCACYTHTSGKVNNVVYTYRQMYKKDHSVRMIQIYDSTSGELVIQFGA